MSESKSWTEWFIDREAWAMSLLRIYLGLALVVKGVSFAANHEALVALMTEQQAPFAGTMLAHLVVLMHIAGGAMLAVGLASRIAALIQLPIVLGAVTLVHGGGSLLAMGESLQFSALVAVLLAAYVWRGSGPLSYDAWAAAHPVAQPAGEDEWHPHPSQTDLHV